jgi:DNA-binding LytR/AlgR family response regulator
MNVLIVEDEPHAARRLETLLRELDSTLRVVGQVDSVKQAVAWFNDNPPPDLVFMDIQLGDGLSFDIFEKVTITSPVIFTTAYDEYALKAFKVNSIDYILKPVDKADVQAALKKLSNLSTRPSAGDDVLRNLEAVMQMMTRRYKERFVIKVGEHLRSIEVTDVLYFYSHEKTTFARTGDGRSLILDFTVEQLEGMLDPDRFFRVNRQYLVSIQAIQDIVHYTNSRLRLILKGSVEEDVIVSRERVQDFRLWLDR